MRRRFFVERFEGDRAVLRGEGAEHLGRVLRAQPGQLYELSDGRSVWLARVEHVARSRRNGNQVEFSLVEPVTAQAPSIVVSLLIAMVKFQRFEWCLEKATELGVLDILPLAARRSSKALLLAAGKRRERWEKILGESAQQSRRVQPPILHAVTAPSDAFAQCQAATKVILSERPDASSFRTALMSSMGTSVALAIGPEGGWVEEEFAAAREAGFIEASLGEHILRTETAVLAGLAIVRYALGE